MIRPSKRPGETPRIVFVASEAHRCSHAVDFDRLGAFTPYRMKDSLKYYGISKLLLCMYAGELSRRLNPHGAVEAAVRALDLCDVGSVAAFATRYRREHRERLHVLVNNAGIHKNIFTPRRKPPASQDGFEIHWRTNCLGPFHLTTLLLPCLKRGGLESGDARVVNVSSHLHDRATNADLFQSRKSYHSWDAYGASKLALIHFSFELDRRFAKPYGLQAVALHPGSVNTNLTRMAPAGGRFGAALDRANFALASLVLLDRKHGAQTVVLCASQSPFEGGCYYDRMKIAEPSGQSRQQSVSRELWGLSYDWVQALGTPESG